MPPRTSSGLSFHGGASPIPIPVPAPTPLIPGPSSGLPSSLESSSDKENSAPGTQQSVVTELVAIVKEEHLDISGESGHMMACRVQDELVRSVLGQRCRSKAHPSCRDCRFHPFPQLGDGGDGFPLVDEDTGNRTSEGGIMSSSEGPDVSERVQLEMQISRPTTAQMVLGQEALFLPDNHPLLQQIQNLVAIQGRVLANSDGPALTRLELTIHMADDEANTLVSSLMGDGVDSPILEGVVDPVVLPAV